MYKLLKNEYSEPDQSMNDKDSSLPRASSPTRGHHRVWVHLTSLLVILLLSANSFLQSTEIRRLQETSQQAIVPASARIGDNIGLERNVPIPWTGGGQWVNDDPKIEDAIWNDPMFDIEEGYVALPDTWAAERNVSLAQRWPWDSHKGIYLVSGHHDVHCIKNLRRVILNAFENKPLGIEVGHAKHCLSILMQDTLCHADDGLMYTGAVHANFGKGNAHPSSGEGQFRMCRDFNKLSKWANQNSACINKTRDLDLPLIDWYKQCPDGSRPWETMLP